MNQIYNIRNYGAIGDGIANDTYAIQQAIKFSYGNTNKLIFPKGSYLTTGIIWITGDLLELNGAGNANLISNGERDYQKIYISGSSGICIDGINFLGGRATGLTTQDGSGIIRIVNTDYITIKNCFIRDTIAYGIHLYGHNFAPKINNNTFENYYVGIYGEAENSRTGHFWQAQINNNIFKSSWCPDGTNYAGAMKLQCNIGESGFSNGNIISNNTISRSSQMGIELWGNIEHTTISNNTIEGTTFGISIANNSRYINVANNNIYGTTFEGIEIADSFGINVIGNTVDGSTGNKNGYVGVTYDGIITNGINRKPNYVNIVGNLVKNCTHSNITNYGCDYTNIIGNTLINSGAQNVGINFYNQVGSHVNFSNNLLNNITTGVYFIFLDCDSSINADGITISNNDFAGSINNWGIFYYNNGNIGNNKNVLIENNRTYNVQFCNYGMVGVNNTPINAIHRNNIGQTGNLGYFISDYQVPTNASPYGTSNIVNGFQYYGNYNYTVPTGGITGDGIWVCFWSGGGGVQNNVRLKLYNDASIDNNYNDIEIWASMVPYEGFYLKHSLMITPLTASNTNSLYKRIKTLSHSSSAVTNSIWVKLAPISTGSVNQLFHCYYGNDLYGNNGLTLPYATYIEPSDTQQNATIDLIDGIPNFRNQSHRFSDGGISVGIGGQQLYSLASGVLNIYPGTGLIINDITNNSGINTPAGFFDLQLPTAGQNWAYIYNNVAGISPTIASRGGVAIGYNQSNGDGETQIYYNSGLGNNPRFEFGGWNGAAKTTNITLKNNNVGIMTRNPSANFHNSGSLRLDGLTISTSANPGVATALPIAPVSYITINITGGNFKIPYYNI